MIRAKTNIHNRFDIICENIKTGEKQEYKAYNIILNQMWTRLVNFQTFFTHIHFGTGTGTPTPDRASLFNFLGANAITTVKRVRALPVSHWTAKIILNPEEYVGQVLTEVGIAYGTSSTSLVTHALIQDSEGNTISITKTDTMVVTIYATIFFELGEIDSMYGGKWRWVQPLTYNDLLSYLVMGWTFPTVYFMVSPVKDFTQFAPKGCAPYSIATSSSIAVADWIKDVTNKKVTTPVRRFGIDQGNGEVRCIGLGADKNNGVFRGQLPIPGVFEGFEVTEVIGVGNDITTGFNLSWNNPQNLTIKINDVVVAPEEYVVVPLKKGTNLFDATNYTLLNGPTGEDYSVLFDRTISQRFAGVFTFTLGIDVGADNALAKVNKFRIYCYSTNRSRHVYLYGANNPDYSDAVQLAYIDGYRGGQWHEVSFEHVMYRYYKIDKQGTYAGSDYSYISEIELLAAEDQITFNNPPPEGAVITATYTVPYIPKTENYVLDLQCAIQYGEGE